MFAELSRIAPDRVRTGGPADAIQQQCPTFVVEPDRAETLAAVLASAADHQQRVVVCGSGTKIASARLRQPIDVKVSTRRLNSIVAHRVGDLTLTVEAGATIASVNQHLRTYGQWLPLDVAFDNATIGGTIATNDSGPLRHRYGAPRDVLIGINLATSDGLLVKSGGAVVKNVAGYDLGKLACGSYGSLAAIVAATFKLTPLPKASRSIVASFVDVDSATETVRAVMTSQLEPSAFEVLFKTGSTASRERHSQIILRFASIESAVDAQLLEARSLLRKATHIEAIDRQEEETWWQRYKRNQWLKEGAIVKLSWMPAALDDVMVLLTHVQRTGLDAIELTGRASVGTGHCRLLGDTASQRTAVERLTSSGTVGNIVVLQGDASLHVHAKEPRAAELIDSLKRRLDPASILATSPPD